MKRWKAAHIVDVVGLDAYHAILDELASQSGKASRQEGEDAR